jgi:hypothetical protein
MHKRLIGYTIIFTLLFSILVPVNLHADENDYWDSTYSYRLEIEIPINTSDPYAKNQPIDIPIKFSNNCWAKNENQHSIRVLFQDGNNHIELDSQIYDLNFNDEEHISSCNIVFLIPDEANGDEKYYLYYHDKEKEAPNYDDKVKVEESKYAYEPIQGVGFESSYFLIKENKNIIYGINWEGEFLNDPASQQVGKFKKGVTEIKPNNGDHLATFSFNYWRYKDDIWNLNSTKEKYVRREIIIDGNLMVKVGIVSESNNGLLRSTVIYKYYFCPTDDKKIFTHVKHEVIGYPLGTGKEIDASYVTLYNGGLSSNSIEELNFGEIPPYLHYYSEDDIVKQFEMEQYPENTDWEESISKEDDFDLGSSAWVSVDYGETGKAHAIILSSNEILKSGEGERDGIELQLYESKNINYPGLDGRFAYLYLMRNDYEKGKPFDTIIPEDFVVEFDALYFTTEEGGYPAVDREASIYQKLITYQPEEDSEIQDDDDIEKYSLTVFTHLSPDLLARISLSNLFLKAPMIYVQLLKDDVSLAVKRVHRIPLTGELKIDWRNITLFRKAHFLDTAADTYVIKVWLDNLIFKRESQLIGYEIIDLKRDTKVRIYCSHEGELNLYVLDQEGDGIGNVQITFKDKGEIIAKGQTGSNGRATLIAPCGLFNSYTMNISYKGFLISSERIRFGRIRQILSMRKILNLDVYDLDINVKDSSGKTPSFDFDISLISPEMDDAIILKPDNISDGIYKFYSLYPANYTLNIRFKSFEIEELLQISETKNIDIDLYDLSIILTDKWDLPPDASLDISLRSSDFKRNVVLSANKVEPGVYLISNLYPGNYNLEVHYKEFSIEKQIEILSGEDKNITMEFSALFNLTTIVLDTRGNPINGANVILIRKNQEIKGTTNDKGKVRFTIPPGDYYIDMFIDDEEIASRKLSVPYEKTYSIVTKSDPILPYIVIIIIVISLIFIAVYSYKKRLPLFFLKILAISLAIIALITPWWELSNCNSDSLVSTSTDLYIMPTEMITLTSNVNVTAGDIQPLNKDFTSVTDHLPTLIIIGILLFIGSIILDRFKKKKLSFLVIIATAAILFASTMVFIIAMSEFTSVGVGSVLGNGKIEVDIPGENIIEKIHCSWGFTLGFYLIFASLIISAILFLLNLRKNLSRIKSFLFKRGEVND